MNIYRPFLAFTDMQSFMDFFLVVHIFFKLTQSSTDCFVLYLVFYHYGAEIPIEEIPFSMAIPNGH